MLCLLSGPIQRRAGGKLPTLPSRIHTGCSLCSDLLHRLPCRTVRSEFDCGMPSVSGRVRHRLTDSCSGNELHGMRCWAVLSHFDHSLPWMPRGIFYQRGRCSHELYRVPCGPEQQHFDFRLPADPNFADRGPEHHRAVWRFDLERSARWIFSGRLRFDCCDLELERN